MRAPEETTEEFLSALQQSDALRQHHKGLLKQFLQHCDLVKFAELEPSTEDIQGTFDACKNFIIETQLDPEEENPARTAA